MALEFPTMADRAIADFEGATKTVSLVVIAKRHGGERDRKAPDNSIVFRFDDDTALVIEGRGRGHRYRAELP